MSSETLSQYDIDRLLGGAGSSAVAPSTPGGKPTGFEKRDGTF